MSLGESLAGMSKERLLVEARRELERVKATQASLAREIQQRPPPPPMPPPQPPQQPSMPPPSETVKLPPSAAALQPQRKRPRTPPADMPISVSGSAALGSSAAGSGE